MQLQAVPTRGHRFSRTLRVISARQHHHAQQLCDATSQLVSRARPCGLQVPKQHPSSNCASCSAALRYHATACCSTFSTPAPRWKATAKLNCACPFSARASAAQIQSSRHSSHRHNHTVRFLHACTHHPAKMRARNSRKQGLSESLDRSAQSEEISGRPGLRRCSS